MPTIKTWSTPCVIEKTRLIPCAVCGNSQFRNALACESFAYVRCTRCGLVQMNPQPETASVIQRYAQNYGADYCAYERANEGEFLKLQVLALKDAGFDLFEQGLLRNAADTEPSVLDIGCATGALLAQLRSQGWQCQGVEISPAAEYARRERSLDVSSLPLEQNYFPDNCFDVVLASHLIEHLNNPAGFVREIFRILRNGGNLFITTPNIAGFQAHVFKSVWRSAIFDHLYLFSVKTLTALLSNAGFQVQCVRTWGGLAAGTAPPWLKKFADRAVKKIGQGDVMIVRARKG